MQDHPLRRLSALGQSVWLDDLRREMLAPGGTLERLIEEEALSGVTSNPAIFEKAIDGSDDYDQSIRDLSRRHPDPEDLYELLTLDDVARAADLLRRRYDETEGSDGFVSIEVSPRLAANPLRSIEEAWRLWEALQRPNILIKIPGTEEGLVATGQLLREGININVTLLFSVERYQEVQNVYLSALEERIHRKLPVDRLRSVASFFLSRIDTLLDPRISDLIQKGGPDSVQAKDLLGMVAVSNATVAYQRFRAMQAGDRWNALRAKGAALQRLLWASTSPKNPLYDDLHYVEPLVGPDTITTLTLKTLDAYRESGRPRIRITDHEDHAMRRMSELEDLGLSLPEACRKLEKEGVRHFLEPYEKVLATIRRKSASPFP